MIKAFAGGSFLRGGERAHRRDRRRLKTLDFARCCSVIGNALTPSAHSKVALAHLPSSACMSLSTVPGWL